MEQTEIQKAISTLKKAFEEDPEYRKSWKDSMIMAIVDEYHYRSQRGSIDIHLIAYEATEKFLNILLQQTK